ncbi:MAG: CcmD family protein [Acidobacteria bacterium]|nr:MAG: CcmD family protein [Acidobacteriota bacterium]HEU0048316.1 CcmD family protein [Nitrososphaera sp.]
MTYLFAAYTAVWVVLFAYVFSLSRRQQKFQDEVMKLQKLLESQKRS